MESIVIGKEKRRGGMLKEFEDLRNELLMGWERRLWQRCIGKKSRKNIKLKGFGGQRYEAANSPLGVGGKKKVHPLPGAPST